MLRPILLALASSRWLKSMMVRFPLARRVARRFVAGEGLEDALNAVRSLRAEDLMVTLDFLGENADTLEGAEESATQYLEVVQAIASAGLESHISLKLTALGLDHGQEVCMAHLERILTAASRHNIFVRIDMEGSDYTEATMQIFEKVRSRHENVGVVLQSYLHRTRADVARANDIKGRVRLCKGAYHESPLIAYQDRNKVNENFVTLMKDLLSHGTYPAIATHDEQMIQATIQYAREHNIDPASFEFQMLYGIRRERQVQLRREGYNVRVYVPFGSQWYPYFMRRLAERPANLVFFLTALFKG
ncbi:MAG: proline dehydrogenase [Candidatus Xenobia bacterium]|jgi:proline dehydrogenase